jgi:hypothetical protein
LQRRRKERYYEGVRAWAFTAVVFLAGCRIGYDRIPLATDADPNAIDADPTAIDGAPGADAGDVTGGLAARYTFDQDVSSDALGQNDASCVPDCPPLSLNGYRGGALDMSGGPDHLVVADDGVVFDHSSGFTVSAWARYRRYSSRSCLITKPLGSTGDNSWALCTEAGGEPFFYSCSPCEFVRASQAIPLDTWVHIAATFDGSSKILYVDGVQSNQGTGSVSFDDRDIVIGGDVDISFGFATDGLLDEIRVYDRALSASEIGIIAGL